MVGFFHLKKVKKRAFSFGLIELSLSPYLNVTVGIFSSMCGDDRGKCCCREIFNKMGGEKIAYWRQKGQFEVLHSSWLCSKNEIGLALPYL